MSVASRPQRQMVSSAASSSVRRFLTSARMSVLNGRASGSSVRGIELHRDEAASQILRHAQTVTSHDYEGRRVQLHHL